MSKIIKYNREKSIELLCDILSKIEDDLIIESKEDIFKFLKNNNLVINIKDNDPIVLLRFI